MLLAALITPLVLQAVAMFVDERLYHRRRELPRWERMGHPLDTFGAIVCYLWLVAARPSRAHAVVYASLAIASSLLVTKDEPIHSRCCSAGEHWIHSVLFLLHPIVLIVAGYLWWTARWRAVIVAELVSATAFAAYQLLYWNGPWRSARIG